MVHKYRLNIERWHGLVSLGVRCAVIGFLLAITMLMAPNRALAQLSTEDQPLSIDGNTPVVARVYFENTDQLNRLAADLDIWEVDHEDGSFVALLSADQHEQVIDAGLHVTVLPEPTAEVINAPVRAQWLRSAGVGEAQDEGIPFYPCYRTVEETYADLADLAAAHPDLASWNDIGDSWDKSTPGGAAGYDLNASGADQHGDSRPTNRDWSVMAAIHAREYTTAELATRFAEHLVAQIWRRCGHHLAARLHRIASDSHRQSGRAQVGRGRLFVAQEHPRFDDLRYPSEGGSTSMRASISTATAASNGMAAPTGVCSSAIHAAI